MTAPTDTTPRPLTRRAFVGASAVLGAGLLLGFRTTARGEAPSTAGRVPEPWSPNGWLHVAPDGAITVLVSATEMGQGVLTSIPMIVAEEMDADFARVTARHLPVDEAHPLPARGRRSTGGSTSIRRSWMPMRTAGAQARAVLVAAAAARWGVAPDECRTEQGRVLHAVSGRSVGYGELVEEAAKLPLPEKPALKDASRFALVGTRAKRLDTAAKVNGTAKYGIDTRVPGMVTAVLARCGACGGTVKSVNDRKARAIPGVKDVVVLEDAVAVIGTGYWPAKQGRDALVVTWDEQAPTVSSATIWKKLREGATQEGKPAFSRGDAKAAAPTVEATYTVPFLAHATMEPMNCTAHVTADGVTVWAPTQNQSDAVDVAAQAAGVPKEKVTLHTTLLGGGFGRRLENDYVRDAVRISKRLGVPVRVVSSREDDMRHDFYRPAAVNVLRGALDAEGWPVLWTHHVSGHASPAGRFGPLQNGIDWHNTSGLVQDFPYAVPNYAATYVEAANDVPTGWWRAVGHTMTAFPVECFVDELAAAARKDPLEVRRRLLAAQPRMLGVLNLAAEKAGWGTPLPRGRGRGIAVVPAFGSFIAMVAEASVAQGAIKVHRLTCAIDCGQVVNPDIVEAQVESGALFGLSAALHGEITFAGGKVTQGNFHDYRVVRMHEAPRIDVHIVPSTEAPGGVGEPGTPPVPAAIANAVFAATGRRLRDLPLRVAAAKA